MPQPRFVWLTRRELATVRFRTPEQREWWDCLDTDGRRAFARHALGDQVIAPDEADVMAQFLEWTDRTWLRASNRELAAIGVLVTALALVSDALLGPTDSVGLVVVLLGVLWATNLDRRRRWRRIDECRALVRRVRT